MGREKKPRKKAGKKSRAGKRAGKKSREKKLRCGSIAGWARWCCPGIAPWWYGGLSETGRYTAGLTLEISGIPAVHRNGRCRYKSYGTISGQWEARPAGKEVQELAVGHDDRPQAVDPRAVLRGGGVGRGAAREAKRLSVTDGYHDHDGTTTARLVAMAIMILLVPL